jgi:hypothetical protein
MRARWASKVAHNSASGRRRSSGIGSSMRNTARSARSDRVTMSSMPFRITGRAASKSTSSWSVYSWRTAKPPPVASRHNVGQPTTKPFRADRPGLPMAVDLEIGEAGAVRGVEQLGRLCQFDQDIGLSGDAGPYRHSPPQSPHRALSPGSRPSSVAPVAIERQRGRISSAPRAAPGRPVQRRRLDPSRSSRRVPPKDHKCPRPRRWRRRCGSLIGSFDRRSLRALFDTGRAAHKHIVEIQSLRRAGDAHAAAFALPPPRAGARRRLAGVVAIGEHDHVAHDLR